MSFNVLNVTCYAILRHILEKSRLHRTLQFILDLVFYVTLIIWYII